MSLAGALILLSALAVSTALLLIVVALVWFLDRYDREPIHMVAAVFIWGAAAAPILSVFTFYALERLWTGSAQALSPILFSGVATPLVEEAAKACGVLLIVLLTRNFDNPTDGFVYGTAVGLGFAVTENYLYDVASMLSVSTDTGSMLTLAAGRTFFSAGVHGMSSATFGGFLGLALLTRSRWRRAAWSLVGLVAAATLHGGWNSALLVLGPFGADGNLRTWLISLPLLYAIYVLIFAAFLQSEHGILKRQLEEEVELATAPAWVADVIPYYRRRLKSDWWPRRNERTVISRLLTRIAFRKHALRHLPRSEASIASLEVVQLRQRIRAILTPDSYDGD
jgi:RsiW-degrading membrane proteinase PrsW (M82 family)